METPAWIVVSSNSISNLHNGEVVIVVPLSSRVNKVNRGSRIFVPASEMIFDPRYQETIDDSIALTEQIRAMSTLRLEVPKIGVLKPNAAASVEAGIAFILDIF